MATVIPIAVKMIKPNSLNLNYRTIIFTQKKKE